MNPPLMESGEQPRRGSSAIGYSALALCVLWMLTLSGCSLLGDSYRLPPAELVTFEPESNIKRLWGLGFGAGADQQYPRLYPALVGDRIVVADRNGQISAVDANIGTVLWSFQSEFEFSAGPGMNNELIVVGTSNGEVLAVESSDGSIRWQVQVTGEVLSTPVIGDSIVVVRTLDGKLFGLDAASGKRIWTYNRPVPLLTLRGTSTPVLTKNSAIAGFDGGQIVAVNLGNGEIQWEKSIATPSGNTAIERLVDIDADLILADGIVYAVAYQGQLVALDPGNGTILWRRDVSSYSGLGVGDTAIYVTDDQSRLWALDRNTGATLWRQDKLIRRILSPPTESNNLVAVADFAGYVHWMSREDGHFIAREDIGHTVVAPIRVADNVFYVYASSGTLTAIAVDR